VRRADRLFQLIQTLRCARRPLTAQDIAEDLEVSVRTVYRDVAELMARGVPLRGEAGIGYVLDRGYDMPPLMLTPDEIEAAILGAQWVAARGDTALRRGASSLIEKIGVVLPERLRPLVEDASLLYPPLMQARADAIDMELVRRSIRDWRKVSLHYVDERGAASERVVWPLAVAYFDSVRLIAAWCELRGGFRHFRADRVLDAEFLDEPIPRTRRALLQEWRESERKRHPVPTPSSATGRPHPCGDTP
jgi:predicted DNA-binding transcriptional regulator YafY